jgi:hypothetical protein
MFGFDAGELLTEGNERFIRLADELYKNIQPLRVSSNDSSGDGLRLTY